jgi:hypothetical protein
VYTDKNTLTNQTNIKEQLKALKSRIKINFKEFIYFIFIIIFVSLLSKLLLTFNRYKEEINNKNIANSIDLNRGKNKIFCSYTKSKLKNRSQPFEYRKELSFITDLILCNIPFSFIRFADGENSIMRGEELKGIDNWHWETNNKKFRQKLIESASICINNNSFIGIPCKNWYRISESILSFSNCTSAKYFSYSTIFTNNNFKSFKDWIIRYINSSNRRKIILIANSIINKNISWAYKFFPIPDNLVDNWDNIGFSLLSKISKIANHKNLIFFISAGPAANIIISYLVKINSKNIYIDFGSSIEFITKGYSTRFYSEKDNLSKKSCETFILKDKKIIYQ